MIKRPAGNGELPWNVGDPKPSAYLGVIAQAQSVETIAKWSSILPQFIEIKSGRNTFLDCVQYSTHENRKITGSIGKHHYDDSEIREFDKAIG